MTAGEFSSVQIEGSIATVTINRPERLNALHPAAHHELAAVFDGLATEESLRAIILTGTGKTFSVGYDLKDFLATGVMEIAPSGFAGLTLRDHYPVPLIAAVNGPALGGGFELALACDLIIAAEDATFSLPEPKVGWAALGGGVQRLVRAIGTKRAMGMILTGRSVTARQALELGFLNEVVPAPSLLGAATEWARQIAECAPLAIRASKDAGYASLDQPDFRTALDLASYPSAAIVFESEDAIEGKRAFAERRKPVWKGR